MIGPSNSKACTNCATARRKCSKQRPSCLRCRTRGQICHYPPSKPTNFIRLPGSETTPGTCSSPSTELTFLSPSQSSLLSPPSPRTTHFPTPSTHLASSWFASPSTWLIDTPPPALKHLTSRFSSNAFDRILAKVLSWLTDWTTNGSCPLIHQQLYRTCFPGCIQDAYLALSTWNAGVNKATVSRIVAEKATKLVERGLIQCPTNVTDALDNLARVQSLLIYQVLSFSSTDLTLRGLADRHVPVLEAWVTLLMQQFGQILSLQSPLMACIPPDVPEGKALWCAWIMAESVRRAWLVVAGLQGLYKLFNSTSTSSSNGQLQSACLGGTLFTSRKGFWEAPSARVWEKCCCERYAGLVRLTETEKLFSMVPREEISEFAKLVLECTFGVEWCEERWGS